MNQLRSFRARATKKFISDLIGWQAQAGDSLLYLSVNPIDRLGSFLQSPPEYRISDCVFEVLGYKGFRDKQLVPGTSLPNPPQIQLFGTFFATPHDYTEHGSSFYRSLISKSWTPSCL